MTTVTAFDTKKRYIFIPIFLTYKTEEKVELKAILDCGAPFIEFSDEALQSAGFLDKPREDIQLKPGQATRKYDKIQLPRIETCSQTLIDVPVYVSHFDKFWGIDALVGLDFFKQFEVRINYKLGQIITEPLSNF